VCVTALRSQTGGRLRTRVRSRALDVGAAAVAAVSERLEGIQDREREENGPGMSS
jgi:hypothetical protein